MKINWSSWLVNILAAVGGTGTMVLALNSPALPKGSVALLIVFAIAMFATNLANAAKASVLPGVNASAVLKHAEEVTPAEGTTMAKAVSVARDIAVKSFSVLFVWAFVGIVAACALFTQVVSVLTASDAALVSCLNDYADATPPNPTTITGASFACAATVEHTVTVLTAELSTPAATDAATSTNAVFTPHIWVFPTTRRERLAAILADAKAKGLVP